MNTFGNTKSKTGSILGRMGFFEEDLEKETSVLSTITSTVKDLLGGVYEAGTDLSQTVVIAKSEEKFSIDGSIKFDQKQAQESEKERAKIDRKKIFFQALKEDVDRARRAKDKLLFEEEINDIATNLPTEQKNQLLGYQAGYRDRSTYQRAELRKKLIEERKKAEKKQKEAEAPKAKGGFNVGENELLMGGERSGGGHWSTTPG